MVVLENRHRFESSVKKKAADSKAKGKKHGSTRDLLGLLLLGKGYWGFIQTKLLNSSTHSGISLATRLPNARTRTIEASLVMAFF